MEFKALCRALGLASLACAPSAPWAAGFQLLEQSASGIASAYAGSAALADDASTVFFNPAGMTRLQEKELSVGLAAVRPSFEFHDQGSLGGVLRGNGDDAGAWALVPNGYLSWAVGRDLRLGVGLSAPFGLVTDYDEPWVGGTHSLKFDIKTANINPSLAWRLNEQWSVGAGLNWQRMDARYRRIVGLANVALASTQATLDADSTAWGWNLGVLYSPTADTRVGFSYRSRVEHDLAGRLRVAGALAGAGPALTTGAAKATVELPDTAIVSLVQRLDRRWEMLADLSWTGWSSIPRVDIARASGALNGVTVQTLGTAFRDTRRIALGAHYALAEAWKLKFGMAWDQTPVKAPASRLVSLPDNNRSWFTTGAQWVVAPGRRLDLGLAYLRVPETAIYNDQRNPNPVLNRGLVNGRYDSSVWILGAQYSLALR